MGSTHATPAAQSVPGERCGQRAVPTGPPDAAGRKDTAPGQNGPGLARGGRAAACRPPAPRGVHRPISPEGAQEACLKVARAPAGLPADNEGLARFRRGHSLTQGLESGQLTAGARAEQVAGGTAWVWGQSRWPAGFPPHSLQSPRAAAPRSLRHVQERARATPAGLGLGAAAPFRNAPQCERDFLGLEPVSHWIRALWTRAPQLFPPVVD